MTWYDKPLAAFDLEATGVDPDSAHIIEVALFRIDADGTSKPLVHQLVNPGVPIPPVVTEITGISDDDVVEGGSDPIEVLNATRLAIIDLVDEGVPIVVYNATYDWPLLSAELARYGLLGLPGVPPAILIDPLVLDRTVDRYRKGKRTLTTAAAHYGVQLDGAHRAANDAAATVEVARAIGRAYPELDLSGPDLIDFQVSAHEEWKASFNEYLNRINASRPLVTGSWPSR